MRLSAGTLLAAGLWPGAFAADDKESGDFHFLAVNDMHYGSEKCAPWFVRVLASMKGHKEKPELFLLGGDQADTGKLEQLGPTRDFCKELGLPYYTVVGNHDYPNDSERKNYDDVYPDRINYHFTHRGWQFIALDTSDGVRYNKIAVQKHTFTWLDEMLPKLDKKKPTVLFTHFPLGPGVSSRPTNADVLLERFKPFNLQAIFCGHYHAFTEGKVGSAIATTNRCCSFVRGNHDKSSEKGYFLCHARDGKLTRTFVEVKPV